MTTADFDAAPQRLAPAPVIPILVTVREAMRLLGRSQCMIYRMLGAGELKGKRDGKRTLLTYASVMERVESLPDWTPGTQRPGLAGLEGGYKRRGKSKPKRTRKQRQLEASA